MNLRRSYKKAILLLSLVATLTFLVPSTLALLFDRTGTLVNTFVPGSIPPVEQELPVTISIQKTVLAPAKKPLSPEGFQFQMTDLNGGTVYTTAADPSGAASFPLHYTSADEGKTFRYRITEINDHRKNVEYSDAAYLVEVSISTQDGQLTASLTVDGKTVSLCELPFENIYDPGVPLPPTGDKNHPGIYLLLMLLSGAALPLLARRRRSA